MADVGGHGDRAKEILSEIEISPPPSPDARDIAMGLVALAHAVLALKAEVVSHRLVTERLVK